MTGRRTASTITDTELDQLYDERDAVTAALREVLNAFSTASVDGVIVGHLLVGAIQPEDMNRWRAVLDQPTEQPS